MKIGLGLPARTIGEVNQYAISVAEFPFDSFSVYGDIGDLSPFIAIQSVVQRLIPSSIPDIGIMGVPVGIYHPEVVSSCARALYEQLGSRYYTGFVRGAFLDQVSSAAAKTSDLESTLLYVKKQADIQRVFLGGYGQKILALARKHAVEGFKVGGSANVLVAKNTKSHLDARTKLVLGSVSVVDADSRVARQLARKEVAKYLHAVGSLDKTLNQDETDSLQQFYDEYTQGNLHAYRRISDSVLDKFAIAGTPEEIVHRLRELEEYVDRFELGTPHGIGDKKEAIRLIGNTIVKEFNS